MDNCKILNFNEEELSEIVEDCFPDIAVDDGKRLITSFIGWVLGK